MMIIEAIFKINSNAKVAITDNDIDQIEWLDGTTPISKTDIEAKMVELQTEYDNNKYQRDRKKEYPSIEDQLDDIYHNGIDGWKSRIKTTKDKYPK
tara:strand:- start:6 stop:293 length:288 start_codon:yes stop_codon:yes gene_type:complete